MNDRFRKSVSVFMLGLFSMLLLTSCQHPSVSVNTKPQGAKVYMSEQYVADTPTMQKPNKWPWETINVRIEKDGYATQAREVTHNLNDTGVIVLVVGIFIWPILLGLLAPGCWNLNPSGMDITLDKK